jgi:Zn-dependent protease with chaperone function
VQEALLRARWFDGRSSQAQPVLVRLAPAPGGPSLSLRRLDAPNEPPREWAFADVGWPERFSLRRLPSHVTVDLQADGSLEFDDARAWYEAFQAAGAKPSLAERMQTRWRVFVVVFIAAAALMVAFYRWGTPWAATQIARHVPLGWEERLSRQALADIDEHILKPSKLPPARQAALRERFALLSARLTPALHRYPGYAPRLELHFRRGMGANAFALPGGTIVVTDGLVEEAAKLGLTDDAVVGVLAHEIGHVVHRHTTRMVVEQGVLNFTLGLALGDTSWAFSNASTLLTALAYRRGHESEADCFAVALMREAGLPTAPMGKLLLALDSGSSAAEEFISSHPDTQGRARKLEAGHAPDCR